MMILIAIISLGAIGVVGALLLFWASKKFEVHEDPRIGQVQSVLPGANCGGCGYAGCAGFAGACVKADSLDGMLCPVGGSPVMSKIATILGKEAAEAEPKVAVVRCNGTCQARPRTNTYDGVKSCSIASTLYGGETGCTFGCLGYGDCEKACNFGAIKVNPETGLPEVDEDKCTACGACVKACPKNIIELRKKVPAVEAIIARRSENEVTSFFISPRNNKMTKKPVTPAKALICVASNGNMNFSKAVTGGLKSK